MVRVEVSELVVNVGFRGGSEAGSNLRLTD